MEQIIINIVAYFVFSFLFAIGFCSNCPRFRSVDGYIYATLFAPIIIIIYIGLIVGDKYAELEK